MSLILDIILLALNILLFGVVFLLLIILIIYFSPSTLKAAITGAPFVPTPKKVIRAGLKLARLKSKEKLYDLGSGTGRVLIIGAKEFGAQVIGFEYSKPLFLLSKINLFLHKIKQVRVYRKSFFEANLKDADVIFMFLTPKAFLKLEKKFLEEIKIGTRIIVFSSPLLFWEPREIISVPGIKAKLYLYTRASASGEEENLLSSPIRE